MPTVTVLSPLTGDTVPSDFTVYASYDLASFDVGTSFLLVCQAGGDAGEVQTYGPFGSPPQDTRSFPFIGFDAGSVDVAVRLFDVTDPDNPALLVTQQVTVTVDPAPVIRIGVGGPVPPGRAKPEVAAGKPIKVGICRDSVSRINWQVVMARPGAQSPVVKDSGNTTPVAGFWYVALPPQWANKHFTFRVSLADSPLFKTSAPVD